MRVIFSPPREIRIKPSVTDACGVPSTRYSIRLAWVDTEFSVQERATKQTSGVLFKVVVLCFGAVSYVTSGTEPTLSRCKTGEVMKA